MKYLILIIFLASCSAPVLKLTVTHVEDLGRFKAVYANRGYMVYKAEFAKGGPADTLRRGSVITALPTDKGNPDSCKWVFRRIR